jgi:hypothetical protein
MIDFNRLSRPKATAAPLDPAEIFAKTPNLNNAPNSLWAGQAEALKFWHRHRGNEDVAVLLNTGAGKSIVGVLIAQSLVNEQIGPVVFACSTIDLVSQTARECDRLGIAYTKRVEGGFTKRPVRNRQGFLHRDLPGARCLSRGKGHPLTPRNSVSQAFEVARSLARILFYRKPLLSFFLRSSWGSPKSRTDRAGSRHATRQR